MCELWYLEHEVLDARGDTALTSFVGNYAGDSMLGLVDFGYMRERAPAVSVSTVILIAVMLGAAEAQPAYIDLRRMYVGPIVGAIVTAKDSTGAVFSSIYDEHQGAYRFDSLPGGIMLEISHPVYGTHEIPIKDWQRREHMPVFLGLAGSEYTYPSGNRMPYVPNYAAVGLLVRGVDRGQLQASVEGLGMELTGDSSLYVVTGATPFDRIRDDRMRALRELPGVSAAGPIVRIGDGALLKNTFLIRLSPRISEDACRGILDRLGALRYTKIMGRLFEVTLDPATTHGVNDVLEQLARRADVEQVTAGLVGFTIRTDAPGGW